MKTGDRFNEFMALYPRCASPDQAARAWVSVVDTGCEDALFACLRRYLASDEVARNIVMEAHNWLFTQAKAKWLGKWPARMEPQKEKGFVASVERVMNERVARGQRPL